MGIVKCGTCSTAAGCESLWIDAGTSIQCTATPAPGNKFLNWTANGNYTSDKPSIKFGTKGAKLVGHFGK